MEASLSASGPARSDRRASRRSRNREHGIVSARVRPGHNAAIIDLSTGGVLVEIVTRLLPGATVDLQIDTAERAITLRGRVLRCAVSHLRPGCVSYRAAIAFDRPCSWCAAFDSQGYEVPATETAQTIAERVDGSLESLHDA